MERPLPVPVTRRLPARPAAPLPSLVIGGMVALVVGKAARWAIHELVSGLLNRALDPRPAAPGPASTNQTITLPPGSRVVTRVWWQTEVYIPPAARPKRRFGLFNDGIRG